MTVATFSDLNVAEPIVHRLREAGVHAELRDETSELRWLQFNLQPRFHLRLLTAESDAEHATRLLNQWDQEDGALREAIRCPSCRSLRVEFSQFSRKTVMGALPAIAAASGLIDRSFYCETCHFTWPVDPPAPEPERDPLGWSKSEKLA